ncbi:MAG: type II 3-dehydroquinate dehydratase [Coriobacteriales bacterium]|nr:type II 3-dehydroquinate dehydratase [Coriobacteriales bacterium]
MRIMVINGPNLNLLGTREPELYGTTTLSELEKTLAGFAAESLPEVELYFFQTNHEGQIIDFIQKAQRSYDGIVYNPAAHAAYSLALRDAVAAVPIPVVEVHLTDITRREEYRRHSLIAEACIAQFMGEGVSSYMKALNFLVEHIKKNTT